MRCTLTFWDSLPRLDPWYEPLGGEPRDRVGEGDSGDEYDQMDHAAFAFDSSWSSTNPSCVAQARWRAVAHVSKDIWISNNEMLRYLRICKARAD
jgi:hypothetical protein